MSPARRKKKQMATSSKLLLLRLYIVEDAIHSVNAVSNLKSICEKYLGNQFKLEIIDVMNEPLLIIKDRILATPTLIKMAPGPVRTIIGDLSDEKKVLDALGVTPPSSS